jgi:hypothetical protein
MQSCFYFYINFMNFHSILYLFVCILPYVPYYIHPNFFLNSRYLFPCNLLSFVHFTYCWNYFKIIMYSKYLILFSSIHLFVYKQLIIHFKLYVIHFFPILSLYFFFYISNQWIELLALCSMHFITFSFFFHRGFMPKSRRIYSKVRRWISINVNCIYTVLTRGYQASELVRIPFARIVFLRIMATWK